MPYRTKSELCREIVEIGRRVYDHFLVAANDGNISARLDDKTILITPTGVSKGFMSPQDILKIKLNEYNQERPSVQKSPAETGSSLVTETDILAVPFGGRFDVSGGALVTPLARQIAMERRVTLEERERLPVKNHRPSSETPMHLAIYRARKDVQAVVHTHAPSVTAFALSDVQLDEPLMPEVMAFIGPVARVTYARPGTEELPQAMAPYLLDHDVFLLDNHGAVTVGRSLEDAYFQMERLELYARIRLAALELGPARTLSPGEVERLTAIWKSSRKRR